jgi:hypothetical protein
MVVVDGGAGGHHAVGHEPMVLDEGDEGAAASPGAARVHHAALLEPLAGAEWGEGAGINRGVAPEHHAAAAEPMEVDEGAGAGHGAARELHAAAPEPMAAVRGAEALIAAVRRGARARRLAHPVLNEDAMFAAAGLDDAIEAVHVPAPRQVEEAEPSSASSVSAGSPQGFGPRLWRMIGGLDQGDGTAMVAALRGAGVADFEMEALAAGSSSHAAAGAVLADITARLHAREEALAAREEALAAREARVEAVEARQHATNMRQAAREEELWARQAVWSSPWDVVGAYVGDAANDEAGVANDQPLLGFAFMPDE